MVNRAVCHRRRGAAWRVCVIKMLITLLEREKERGRERERGRSGSKIIAGWERNKIASRSRFEALCRGGNSGLLWDTIGSDERRHEIRLTQFLAEILLDRFVIGFWLRLKENMIEAIIFYCKTTRELLRGISWWWFVY